MWLNVLVVSWFTLEKFVVLNYWKYLSKLCQPFSIQHKINKSNAKLSTHYWIICLCSINICCDIFTSCEFLNFFWNEFSSKTIKLCCITIIHILSYPMSFYWFLLIKIYYICPNLNLSQTSFLMNAIKFGLILEISLYFKISYSTRWH